jgi:DNA-binding GntR family transcriptional regulator
LISSGKKLLLKNIKEILIAQKDPTTKAYMGIQNMMFKKAIVPGQKISPRDLSRQLQMSPTPIIQALKWLELLGFVHRKPNRGYFATPINLQEVGEIYELRELLEPALLEKSLKKLDDHGKQRLKIALDAHHKASRETYLNERIIRDMEYHLTLASLSGKTIQQKTLQHVFDLLCIKYRGNFASATSSQTTDDEHRQIFEAVINLQLNRAKQVLQQHIAHAKNKVIVSLKQVLEEKTNSFF